MHKSVTCDLAVLAIADTVSDKFAGSLVVFNVSDDQAEVVFWLRPAHHGTGVTSSVLDLAVDFCRDSGLRVLTARTMPENVASQRVLATAGFDFQNRDVGTTPSGKMPSY